MLGVAFVVLAVASAWSENPYELVLPVSGEFRDLASSTAVVYEGTFTLSWWPVENEGAGRPVEGILAATAVSRSTGTSYRLSGCCSGSCALAAVLAVPFQAVGYGEMRAFDGIIKVTLSAADAQKPPLIQEVALLGY
jgi:hypothetical protein